MHTNIHMIADSHHLGVFGLWEKKFIMMCVTLSGCVFSTPCVSFCECGLLRFCGGVCCGYPECVCVWM